MCMRERSGTGTFGRGRVDLGQAHFGEDALTADRVDRGQAHLGEDASTRDRHISVRTRRSGTGTFGRSMSPAIAENSDEKLG